jgi:plasmid stabilization system protein ParE
VARLAIEFLDEAKADFREAIAWYRQNAAMKIARQFTISVENLLKQISSYPKSGTELHGNVRRSYLGSFPFWLYYVETGNCIQVIAILHAKLDSEMHLARIQ